MKRPLLKYSILISIGILLASISSALSWQSVNVAEGTPAGIAISSLIIGGGTPGNVEIGKMTTALPSAAGSSFVTGFVGGGTTVAPSETAFDTRRIQPSLDQLISRSSWFALSSGVASIISLIVTLYGTQIKTIPFSLYRSYVWNKVLLLSFGIGIIVFAGMQFYTQTEPPEYLYLNYIFSVLHGKQTYFISSGTNLWGVIFFIGAAISIWGIIYDPVQISKSVIFREHNALLEYRKEQLTSVLGKHDYENLKSHERHLYDDLSDFHVELQTRLINTVYGQGPHAMFTRRIRNQDSGEKGEATKARG